MDPVIGRFTSPDTIVPDPYNSQDYDRYSYVRNNPLRYTDPSGHDPDGDCIDSGYCPDNRVVVLAQKIHAKYKNITISDILKWNLTDLQEIYDGLNEIMGKNGFNGDTDAFVTAFGEVTFVPVSNGSLGQQEDSITGKMVNNIATTLNGIVKVTPEAGKWAIVHEMGHIFSAAPKVDGRTTTSFGKMYSNIFTASGTTTQYGKTNSGEDFAESFYVEIRYGDTTAKISDDRKRVIRALIQSYIEFIQTKSR